MRARRNEPSQESLSEMRNAVEADEVLNLLAGRWKMMILKRLFEHGTQRFSEFERAIPTISQKMLAQQLRELERDGILERTVFAEVPPKVEYDPTDLRLAQNLRRRKVLPR